VDEPPQVVGGVADRPVGADGVAFSVKVPLGPAPGAVFVAASEAVPEAMETPIVPDPVKL
jgi:hypothetical protein